ncbi:MAG: hypothetical protein MR936_01030 [Eubacterium sp.]|nr:hypothetical protein [Eubacterium sp.]
MTTVLGVYVPGLLERNGYKIIKVRKTFDKNILATLFLICFICVFFTIAAFQVNRLATESCFDTLDDTAIQVAADIRTHVAADLEQLSVIADLLAQHEEQDSETIRRHLSSFSHRGTIAALGLLLPDRWR